MIHLLFPVSVIIFSLIIDNWLSNLSFSKIIPSQCFHKDKGLWVYVDSLYSTYLVVQIRLSYDDSTYLVIEIMTYDKEFFMKDKKKEEKVKIHVQR